MYNKSEGLKFKSKEELTKHEQGSLKITTIAGPMFAGKSAELIEMIARLEVAKQDYICFRPESSKRKNDDTAHITSRSKNLSAKASFLKNEFDANEMAETIDSYDVFIFDEIHFLDLNSIKNFVQKCVETHKKKEIIFAGLDMDFLGKKFAQFEYACEISDKSILLTAQCSIEGCNKRATHSAKIGGDKTKQIEAAGEDLYKACCKKHWDEINKANGIVTK